MQWFSPTAPEAVLNSIQPFAIPGRMAITEVSETPQNNHSPFESAIDASNLQILETQQLNGMFFAHFSNRHSLLALGGLPGASKSSPGGFGEPSLALRFPQFKENIAILVTSDGLNDRLPSLLQLGLTLDLAHVVSERSPP